MLSSCPHACRLFQPVQYGQKPEGRTVAFPSTHPPRTATSTAATATPQGHIRGRPPIATFSANPDAKGVSCVVVCLPRRVLGPPFCRRDLCSPRTTWRLFYAFKLDLTRHCTLSGGVCDVPMRMLLGGSSSRELGSKASEEVTAVFHALLCRHLIHSREGQGRGHTGDAGSAPARQRVLRPCAQRF